MNRCPDCNKKLRRDPNSCPRCGWKNNTKEDHISLGLCLISLLIPLFGITYWIAEAHEKPRRARACGLTAILGPPILGILGLILLLRAIIMLA